jgi:hypothetical protein
MGRILTLLSFAGAAVLVLIVILAILALTGQFDHQYTNPPT